MDGKAQKAAFRAAEKAMRLEEDLYPKNGPTVGPDENGTGPRENNAGPETHIRTIEREEIQREGEKSETPDPSKPETAEPPTVTTASLAQLEEILGMFVAVGRGVSSADYEMCVRCWNAYTVADQIRAYHSTVEAFDQWKTKTTDKIPLPVNWFVEDRWQRYPARRLPIQAPKTATQQRIEEAKRKFRAGV